MGNAELSEEDILRELVRRRAARADGGAYREYVSGLPVARHSRLIWDKLNTIEPGCGKRLMFFLPPGSAKTTDVSHHFPARYLSKYPQYPIIGATHTDKFAEQNGRRVRGIIQSEEHQRLYPGITISDESSAAARWELNTGAAYMGFGVGATVVGRRAGGIIMDDVVAGIQAADSQTERDFVWSWYGADLSTRLVPGGWIILVMTRYHLDDIAGRLIAAAKQKYGDKWEIISLPALAKDADPLGRKPGEALWPEWQNEKELHRIKHQPSMVQRMWESLYQQSPVIESGNLIKRDQIRIWNQKDPPKCHYILQSYDTAITGKNKSAYSVCLTFGIFNEPETGLPAVILLSRWRARVDYPDLRKMAQRLALDYLDDVLERPTEGKYKRPPDDILIESKATGEPLRADLARAGVSTLPFNPNKYGDKEARLMLCTDIFENGRFWVPGQPPNYTMPRRWAEEYVNSLITFPASDSKDDADATSQALIRLKTSGWVKNSLDPTKPEYTRVGRQLVRESLYG